MRGRFQKVSNTDEKVFLEENNKTVESQPPNKLKRRRVKLSASDNDLDKSTQEILSAIRENPIRKKTNLKPLPAIPAGTNGRTRNSRPRKNTTEKDELSADEFKSETPRSNSVLERLLYEPNEGISVHCDGSKEDAYALSVENCNSVKEVYSTTKLFEEDDTNSSSSKKPARNRRQRSSINTDNWENDSLTTPKASKKKTPLTKRAQADQRASPRQNSRSRNSTPTSSVSTPIRNLSLQDDIIEDCNIIKTPRSPHSNRSRRHRLGLNTVDAAVSSAERDDKISQGNSSEIFSLFQNDSLRERNSSRHSQRTRPENQSSLASVFEANDDTDANSILSPSWDERGSGILTSPRRYKKRNLSREIGVRNSNSTENIISSPVLHRTFGPESHYDPTSICRSHKNSFDDSGRTGERFPRRRVHGKYLPPLSETTSSKQ